MRWPWVSRLAYDVVCVERDAGRQLLYQTHDRYEALLEKYHALACPAQAKADGIPPAQPEREVSAITQVIRDQSDGDPRLQRHLRVYANQLKKQGKDESEIIAALTKWESTEVADD